MISPLHLYRPSGVDRVAIVVVLPSSTGDGLLVQVARGKTRKTLGAAKVYGPFDEATASAVLAREVAALRAEGYVGAGLGALLTTLSGKSKRRRALAAKRLGWARASGAVEALLAAAAKASDDLPAIVDALGQIGDPRAIPFCRTIAAKKLLSRRRSGVEALRALGDAEGLDAAREVAMARLPDAVRALVEKADPVDASPSATLPIASAALAAPTRDRGLALDTLYEIGTPVCVAAMRLGTVKEELGAPHTWRYVKSIFKRSMLRLDAATFGWLAHAIESAARDATGTTATVKSGYDGEPRTTRIFGRRTQAYVKRAAWRHLRLIAKHRPSLYAHAAAEVLVHYTHDDEDAPSGRYGTYARAHLLHRILWGSSARHELTRDLRFRLRSSKLASAPPGAREEAFPALWDAEPRAYVRLLAAARLPVVHELALAAVRRGHASVVEGASHAEVAAMLAAPHPPTVELALAELRRRFDAARPDWDLVCTLVGDARPVVRTLGLEWLAETAPAWTRDPARIVSLLSLADETARAAVAHHVLAALPEAPAAVRARLAEVLLAVLRGAEPSEGAHDDHGHVAVALAAEIAALASQDELVLLLATGSPAAQGVAASALAQKPGAAAALGIEQLEAMSDHALFPVRRASHALLRQLLSELHADPSPLFGMLESAWEDSRRFAAELFRTEIPTDGLSPEALLEFCDSNRADVQELGRELVTRHFARLDAQLLVKRLTQHPSPRMRAWAVELTVRHLKDGYVPLASLEAFFRTVLLDVTPDRAAKRAVLAFLTERGLRDERQAEVASRLLSDFVRSKTKDDFERALGGLARIKLAFPGVASVVALRHEVPR